MYYNNYYYGGYNNLPRMNFSRVYPRVVVYNRNFAELPDTWENKYKLVENAGLNGPVSQDPLFKDNNETGRKIKANQEDTQISLDILDFFPKFKRKLIDNPSQFSGPRTIELYKSLMRLAASNPKLSSKQKRQHISDLRSNLYRRAADHAVVLARNAGDAEYYASLQRNS